MRVIWGLLAVAAAAYAGMCAYLYLFQSRFIYFPERHLSATPDQRGLNYETVRITTTDGVQLHGWYVPARGARGTLLFMHGNAGNISHRLDSLLLFNRLGLNVLIFDYRGYGQSTGTPSERGTYLDADAAWRYLTERRGIAANHIVLFGRSLGGAVAAELAARHSPAALILESTFRSVPAMAHRIAPWFPARLLARYRYDSLQNIRRVHCPVLIAHSKQDEIIPYAEGRALFAAARPPKQFLELRGDHNSGFLSSGQHYRDELNRFLTAYLPP